MTAQNTHVVIVDDDPPVRRALARLLASAGFEVSVCGSAEEFLIRRHELRPACLLLDIHLPRLSGLDLEALLGRVSRTVPVIFITADHDLARSEEVRQAGRPCLIKPIDDETLLSAISTATASH